MTWKIVETLETSVLYHILVANPCDARETIENQILKKKNLLILVYIEYLFMVV